MSENQLGFNPENLREWLVPFKYLSSEEAEIVLEPCQPGTFLVRKSGQRTECYVLSIRQADETTKDGLKIVSHVYITVDRSNSNVTYIIGNTRFQRIRLLLGHYGRNPLWGTLKLQRACPEINVERLKKRKPANSYENPRRDGKLKPNLLPNPECERDYTRYIANAATDRDILCSEFYLSTPRRTKIEPKYVLMKFDDTRYHPPTKVTFHETVIWTFIEKIPMQCRDDVWAAPKPLATNQVIAIREELNNIKSVMDIHPDSKKFTKYYDF